MKDSIQAFYFERREVRVIERDGEPWFVAADVCAVLGISNSRDAISALDDDERNTVGISDGNRGNPNMNIISESGLYTLIMRSNKPEARAFRKWVTGTVLPALRKYGAYRVNGMEGLSNPALSSGDDLMLVRDYSKVLKENGIDMGEKKLFDWFRENGYLIGTTDGKSNIISAESERMGLFKPCQWLVVGQSGYSKVKITPKLTARGRAYFLDALRLQTPALPVEEPAALPVVEECEAPAKKRGGRSAKKR